MRRGVAVAAVACGALGCAKPSPPPDAGPPPMPKTRFVECPSHSLGVSLSRKGETDEYEAYARDNYQDARYPSCTWTREAIRCDGTWSFSSQPASLRVERRGEKLLVTIASPRGGADTYPCFATDEGLGACVLNPGTPVCPTPPGSR